MNRNIAGHTFQKTCNGWKCQCGETWGDLVWHIQLHWVGRPLGHNGAIVTAADYAEVKAQKHRDFWMIKVQGTAVLIAIVLAFLGIWYVVAVTRFPLGKLIAAVAFAALAGGCAYYTDKSLERESGWGDRITQVVLHYGAAATFAAFAGFLVFLCVVGA